jgi:hypothetical protein
LHQEWFNLEPRFHPQKKVLTWCVIRQKRYFLLVIHTYPSILFLVIVFW